MRSIKIVCIVIVISILSGLIYVAVQQVYRSSANDPQIEMAEKLAVRLKLNKPVNKYFEDDSVDLSSSKSIFVTIYDDKGKPINSNGYIRGSWPQLPQGVFEYAKSHGEDRITWQPEKTIRMAMVIVYNGNQFVAAGRSLKEVEIRVSNLTTMIIFSWILSIATILVYALTKYYYQRRQKQE